MISTQQKTRLFQLLGDHCNDTLDTADGQWLEELVCSDGEVQELYLDYMALHACLHAEGISPEGSGDRLSRSDSLHEDVLTLADAKSVVFGRQRRNKSAFGSRHWMLAATLACVALFSSYMTYHAMTGSGQHVAAGTGANASEVIARITGTQNCLWQQIETTIGYGTELVAGQELELKEGLAEITFADGATMLVESPAKFVIDAPHVMQLHSGRLAAVVPPQSSRFRVHTRSLDVYEVGTEFGLLAKQSGATELHVFNGLVRANVLDSLGRPQRQLELNALEAARINPVSTTVMEFPANSEKFVRSMMPSSGPQDGLLVYEGFDYPEGPLSAQNGGFGWAGPWFDIAADSEAGPNSNRVGTGSLTVEGILPRGNRAMQIAQQNRIRRSLATSVGGVFDVAGLVENQDGVRLVGQDGHSVYISFLQKVSDVDDQFYGVELHRGDGNGNRVLCIGHGVDETGYGVTSNTNVYGPGNFPSLGTENTEANFFVIKISFGVDNRDQVEVFRNPESLRDENDCSPDVVLQGNFAFDRISMANFHGEKIHEVDEIRVGTHFLAVTGRWGGERGRLLRRLTQQRSFPNPSVADVANTRNNFPLLAFIRN